MKKCLVFGSLNLDYFYSVDHILNSKETQSARQMQCFCGGKGLNQAVALSQGGASVHFAGCLGQASSLLSDTLAQYHIDTRYLRSVDQPAGHAIIQVDRTGQNAILVYPGSNYAITSAQIDETLANFQAGDLLVIQNEINRLEELIHKAHERGLIIALNPSPTPADPGQLPLNEIDLLFINEVEGAFFSGQIEPEAILDYFAKVFPHTQVILTLGDQGSCLQEGRQRIFLPCCPVEVVDTVGAGDTFTGFFLAAKLAGKSALDCLAIATAASACAVTKKGASVSIPTLAEAQTLLNQYHDFLWSKKTEITF